MSDNFDTTKEKGAFFTLFVAFSLAGGFLLWGILIFYTVGVKWPPAWNFGSVADVPGLSIHSTVSQKPIPSVPHFYLHEGAVLAPQHVKGRSQISEKNNKESSR